LQRRANAVAADLETKFNISPSRLEAIGVGEKSPRPHRQPERMTELRPPKVGPEQNLSYQPPKMLTRDQRLGRLV